MDGGERLIELGRIARALEDEGHYQSAKLFRAALLSELADATRDRPRTKEQLARAIADAERWIDEQSRLSPLAEPISLVAETVRAGKMRFEGDLAPVWVCRYCGQTMRSSRPDACPGCGAGWLSFEAVPAVFYLLPLDRDIVIGALEAFPRVVAGVCAGLSEADAGSGEWPPRDVVSHLLGAQRLLGRRALQTLAEDEPEFRPVPPTEVAEKSDGGRPTVGELVARFRETRDAFLEKLRPAGSDQLRRIGRHPQWGPMTLLQQISYIARHEHSHLGDLARAVTGRSQGSAS